MAEDVLKLRKVRLASGAAALFMLAGTIEFVTGMMSETARSTNVSTGAMFVCVGAMWLAIGARWKKKYDAANNCGCGTRPGW